MKWKVAGVMVLAMLGCSNDVQEPERSGGTIVNTPTGEVLIENVNRDDVRQELTARVIGDDIEAVFRVTAAGDGIVTQGGTVTLTDMSGKTLFLLEVVTNNSTGEVTYTQATSDDYLTFSILETEDHVRETYDANGDVASFDYPLLTDETQRHAINHLEHGLPIDHLPSDIAEYVRQAGAFRDFYLRHSTSSLHHNEAGELLVAILASPELAEAALGDDFGAQRTRVTDTFCGLVTACSAFACRLWPANPVCVACSGATAACAIFMILSMWIPGWN